ncbi:MAG: exodeoxyribonuclease III [Candidatus Krumholzibacteriia bacterium]
MELISWNVNGLRAALQRGAREFLAGCGADVICLQEVRATPEQVDLPLAGYRAVWNPAQKPGYSGTAVFLREEITPRETARELGHREHDTEGRVVRMELDDFHLVNVYTPNAQRGLVRLEYRLRWDADFLAHLRVLDRDKPVVLCGDLNVAHQEIDIARPRENRRNAGFSDEERAGIDRLVAAGFVDTFRMFVSEGGHYSWWNQRPGVRQRNIGWRLDYFFVSQRLRPRVAGARILSDVMGSDHAPVSLTLR